MTEAHIVINGNRLTDAQSMTVRVALESFAVTMADGLGHDAHGRQMVAGYKESILDIREYMTLGNYLKSGRRSIKVAVDKTPHECKFVFMRQEEEVEGGFRPDTNYFDVFFCEGCLTYKRILVAKSITYGDGRREKRSLAGK